MTTKAVPDTAQLLLVVTAHVQPAQLDYARAVLQFFPHVIKKVRGIGQREIVVIDIAPFEVRDLFERDIDLLQYNCWKLFDPSLILGHLRAPPNKGTLQIARLRHEASNETDLKHCW
jgi:hypothetical protein